MNREYYEKFEPINGKWYIVGELGSGSYGSVFEVERRDFKTTHSAMKIVTIPPSETEVESYRRENYDLDEKSITSYFYGFVEEFVKEFEIMSKIKGHSNIVSYEDHDVVEHKDGIGWDIFIRMELLTPMNEYFKTHPVTKESVIRLGIDICKALEVCEIYDIIHRDIKPGNIFISNTGDFKLGDFGVARTLEKTSSGLSQKGTFTYMAPEVSKNEPYGKTVDVYSLGIVLYRLMNNNMEPFATSRTYSDSTEALERRMRGETLPPPANADKNLAKVILKACAYSPADRYTSPALMRQDLEALLSNAGSDVIAEFEVDEEKSVTKGIYDGAPTEETISIFSGATTLSEQNTQELYKTENKTKRKKRLYIAIAAIALILIVLLLVRNFGTQTSYVAVSSIEYVPETVTLLVDDEYQLNPSVYPDNATYDNLLYEVEDETIAEVDSDGTIIALSEGKTILTVTCDGVSQVMQLEVIANINGEELEEKFKQAQKKLEEVLSSNKINQANVAYETDLMQRTLANYDIESISEYDSKTLVVIFGEYNDSVLPALERLNEAYEIAMNIGKSSTKSTSGGGKSSGGSSTPPASITPKTVAPATCPVCGSTYHTTHPGSAPPEIIQ